MNLNGVNYFERTGNAAPGESPVESFVTDMPRSVRTFLDIPWGSRQVWTQNVLGYASNNPQVGGSPYINRRIPLACDDWTTPGAYGEPTPVYLYAENIQEMRGAGVPVVNPLQNAALGAMQNAQNTAARYQWAIATVNFGYAQHDILSDDQMRAGGWADTHNLPDEATGRRYVVRVIRTMARFVSLKTQGIGVLAFASGANAGNLIAAAPGLMRVTKTIEVTHVDVPFSCLPTVDYNPNLQPGGLLDTSSNKTGTLGALDFMAGSVNHDTFLGYPAGSLLFESFDCRPRRNPFGYRQSSPCIILTFDPQGHNNALGVLSKTPLMIGFVEVNTQSVDPGGKLTGGPPKPIPSSYAVSATSGAILTLTLAPDPYTGVTQTDHNLSTGQIVRVDQDNGAGLHLDTDYIATRSSATKITILTDAGGNPVTITGNVQPCRIIPRGIHIYQANDLRRLLRAPGQF